MRSNKHLISDYIDYRRYKGHSEITIRNIGSYLKSYDKFIGKPFNDVQESDIIGYLSKYKPNTRNSKLSALRDFYRHMHKLEKEDKLPDYIRRIPFVRVKKDEVKYREKIVTEEEYNLILGMCSTPKHRAIVETFYNFGIRKSELSSMNYKDVVYTGVFTKITVRISKTDTRDVIFDGRSKYLMEWVETYYPYKDKPDMPLFYPTETKKDKRYCKQSYNNMMTSISEKAGIKRKITPHDFRHTCITDHCKEGTNESFLKINMGLKKDTKMLSTYNHAKLKDYEEYLIKKNRETEPTYESLKEKTDEISELKSSIKKMEDIFMDLGIIERNKDGLVNLTKNGESWFIARKYAIENGEKFPSTINK